MGIRRGSISTPIIADGLVFNVDAANRASTIPSTSTTTTFNTLNLSQQGSFINDTMYDSSTVSPSYAFDGTGDYIDFSNYLNFVTSNYSSGFWIKTTANSNLVICEKGSNDELAIQTLAGGNIRWAGTNSFDSSGVAINDDEWHYLFFVANDSNSFIFIDGVLNITGGNKIQGSNNSSNFLMGGRTTSFNFPGNIQLFHLYTRALSANEVLHNYNALKSRFGL